MLRHLGPLKYLNYFRSDMTKMTIQHNFVALVIFHPDALNFTFCVNLIENP